MKTNTRIFAFCFVVFLLSATGSKAQIISTFAGGDSVSIGDGGPAIDCELLQPYSTAIDAAGNVYIADLGHNRVRKVNTAGIITTIAGTGVAGYSGDDSAATAAQLNTPAGVAVDGSGNVYISDDYNHRIRKVDAAGIITSIAGTGAYGYNGDNIAATAATLYSPHEIALDGGGNLYICDVLNYRLRKINTSGVITTIAGAGAAGATYTDGMAATAANIAEPFGVAIDAAGNVFFCANGYLKVCKVNTAGIISTVAGTGSVGYSGDDSAATAARMKEPFGVTVDAQGNIYFGDPFNARVRKIDAAGIITTYAGNGINGYSGDYGLASHAEIDGPVGVMADNAGNLYICSHNDGRIRYIRNTVSVKPVINPAFDMDIYPNPNHGDFNLTVSSAIREDMKITITDVSGRKVKECTAFTNAPLMLHLDERSGLYFISVTTSQGILTRKLLVTP